MAAARMQSLCRIIDASMRSGKPPISNIGSRIQAGRAGSRLVTFQTCPQNPVPASSSGPRTRQVELWSKAVLPEARQPLILRRVPDVVQNDHFDWALAGLQFQAELIAEGLLKCRAVRVARRPLTLACAVARESGVNSRRKSKVPLSPVPSIIRAAEVDQLTPACRR